MENQDWYSDRDVFPEPDRIPEPSRNLLPTLPAGPDSKEHLFRWWRWTTRNVARELLKPETARLLFDALKKHFVLIDEHGDARPVRPAPQVAQLRREVEDDPYLEKELARRIALVDGENEKQEKPEAEEAQDEPTTTKDGE